MKLYQLKYKLCAILLLPLFFSCEKNEYDDIEADGSGSAMINGLHWEGKARVIIRGDKIDLILQKYTFIADEWYPEDDLLIGPIVLTRDSVQRVYEEYAFHGPREEAPKISGSFGTIIDGDGGCDSYEVYEADSVNNWVRIDREQGNFKKIWGSFSMHLYREKTCSESPRPEADTLKITDGTFVVEL